ncbi:MAG TPA: hypothetical protein VD905_21885 [Flavobacteriales bacterium]|nr:hypothetical protein [Flavobacteriales bacterium]
MARSFLVLLYLLPCTLFAQQDSAVIISTIDKTVEAINADTTLKRIEVLRVKGSRQILAWVNRDNYPVKTTHYTSKNNNVTSLTYYYYHNYPVYIEQSKHFNAKNKSSIPEERKFYFEYSTCIASFPKNYTITEKETDKLLEQATQCMQLVKKQFLNDPLKTFAYDRVEGYSLKHSGEWNGLHSFNYTKIEEKGKQLSQKQIDMLAKLVRDTNTFSMTGSACFNPGMAIAFYKNDTVVGLISVCLDCNYLDSWGFSIPANDYYSSPLCLGCNGLSGDARKKLVKLCNELQLQQCYDSREKENKE